MILRRQLSGVLTKNLSCVLNKMGSYCRLAGPYLSFCNGHLSALWRKAWGEIYHISSCFLQMLAAASSLEPFVLFYPATKLFKFMCIHLNTFPITHASCFFCSRAVLRSFSFLQDRCWEKREFLCSEMGLTELQFK